MSYFSYFRLAAWYIIAVSVCGGIPQPQDIGTASNRNVDVADGFLGVPQWLRSAFSSFIPPVFEEMNPDRKVDSHQFTKKQENDNSLHVREDVHVLPILIHKEDELSGINFSLSPLLGNDRINPFIRTKRSACKIPAKLPKMVSELNLHLNNSLFLGLSTEQQYQNSIITDQPKQCHNDTTNKWWPRPEINFRSTCPWNITEHDLGENAFPRYINKAFCLCIECIGSPAFRCQEITQNVTYFYREGCQDGLSLMVKMNIKITVGCHCVTGKPQ